MTRKKTANGKQYFVLCFSTGLQEVLYSNSVKGNNDDDFETVFPAAIC